jgi:NADP-dependent 3-hydroxy acid dehydrogenase YdfG
MPFALDRLDVFAALPPNLSCRVWRSDDVGNGKLERLDIELFDDDGKVLARLSGLTSRAAETGTVETASQAIEAAADSCVTHLLAPVWAAVPVPAPLDSPADMRVLVAGGTVEQREAIVALYPDARHLEYRPTVAGRDVELNIAEPFDHLVWIAPPSGGTLAEMADAQAGGVMHLFSLIRAHLRAGRTLDELSWTIVTLGACAITAGETLDPTHAAVHGLAGSMAKEFPHWRVRMLDVARGDVLPVDAIFRAPFDPAGEVLARRDDVWFHQELLPADWPETDAPAYRPDGTYLVIGGAGGLGEAWSRAVIEAHDAQVVWVGRRPLDADIQRKLDALAQSGPAPVYINADAGDPVALARACADIRARFGRIDGVVHSALVLEDRSLAAMEPEAFRAALHPKVDASIALARALTGSLDNAPAGDAPDFVLFFSSLQSFTMAAGQSNYAAGSTFADALADALPAHLACPVKVMNWGYWGSVGIVADDLYRERMARAGLVSIEPEEGMAALAGLLSGPFARLALVKTRAGLELGGPAGAADGRVTVYRAEIPSGIQLLATS